MEKDTVRARWSPGSSPPGSEGAKVRRMTSRRSENSTLGYYPTSELTRVRACADRTRVCVHRGQRAVDRLAVSSAANSFPPGPADPSLGAREGGTGVLTPFRRFSFTAWPYDRTSAAASGKLRAHTPESEELRLWGPQGRYNGRALLFGRGAATHRAGNEPGGRLASQTSFFLLLFF